MKDEIRSFFLFLIICSAISKKSRALNVKFQNYYYLQKLYPGTDLINSFVSLKENMKLYFFTLNKKMLYFTNNGNDIKIQGSIYYLL